MGTLGKTYQNWSIATLHSCGCGRVTCVRERAAERERIEAIIAAQEALFDEPTLPQRCESFERLPVAA